MTFDTNKFTDVVLDVSHETPNIGQAAAKQLKQFILKAQSADIDAVSGATVTTKGITKGANAALAAAEAMA